MARAIAAEIMKTIQPSASAQLTRPPCQSSVATGLTAVAPDLPAMENAVEA